MPVAADLRLTHYRVLSPLGSGGGGEVYRARDLRLHRDVALKIISARTADTETIRRFEQEAQHVAALNHPNIVTVYEAGRDGENLFIATELVEGQSLRQLLELDGAMPLNRTLDYGLQIAEGLAGAHDEGIVHRDLKPENVMITRAGRVKIVDFGIAKVVEADTWSALRTLGNNDTAPGLLLGTTAYMSPEQARGGRASYPADQFALGLLLYEMVTGDAPFRRESPLATLSAVLTEDVPEVPVGSPAFRWLVKRLLHKEPDHRYGSMHDVVRELQSIRTRLTQQGEISVPETLPPLGGVPAVRRSWLPVAVLAAVCALAGFVVGSGTSSPATAPTPVYTPLVNAEGLQIFPAFSPDARLMAWSGEDNGGILQIFIGSRGSDARPLQLTSGNEDALFPFWAPDGSRTFYISGNALWSVSAAGGEPQRLLDNVLQAAIAPDGVTFALLRANSPGGLARIHVGRLNSLHALGDAVLTPAWLRFSPDGKGLGAWVTRQDGVADFRLIGMPGLQVVSRLPALRIPSPARPFCWSMRGNEIVFSDRAAGLPVSHLFVADLDSGDVHALTSGIGGEWFPATGNKGRQIAFTSAQPDYDVIRISFTGEREELSATSRYDLSPVLTSTAMSWVSDRSGTPEILVRSLADGQERSLLGPDSFGEDRTSALGDLAIAPDGRRLAFWRAGSDDEAIWIASLTGGAPVRLGKEPGDAIQRGPSWSPDGQELVYFSVRNDSYVLVRARPGAAEGPRVIARDAGVYPRWNAAGTHIATLAPGGGAYILQADGSERRQVGKGRWLLHGWSADGKLLYGVRRSGTTLELVAVDVATTTEKVAASLGDYPAEFSVGAALGLPPFRGWSVRPDGKGFVTSVLGMDADLWLLER